MAGTSRMTAFAMHDQPYPPCPPEPLQRMSTSFMSFEHHVASVCRTCSSRSSVASRRSISSFSSWSPRRRAETSLDTCTQTREGHQHVVQTERRGQKGGGG